MGKKGPALEAGRIPSAARTDDAEKINSACLRKARVVVQDTLTMTMTIHDSSERLARHGHAINVRDQPPRPPPASTSAPAATQGTTRHQAGVTGSRCGRHWRPRIAVHRSEPSPAPDAFHVDGAVVGPSTAAHGPRSLGIESMCASPDGHPCGRSPGAAMR